MRAQVSKTIGNIIMQAVKGIRKELIIRRQMLQPGQRPA